ncbi:MAG: hypothetical protein H7062_05015, partial [Candidatus Saccharimonas sp.]|nr:hypothetical protein [Planctomycetaceae bacterium]
MRFIFVGMIATLLGLGTVAALADDARKPLKVCILSGCDTYKSEESLPPFQEFLERHYNVRCSRVVRKAVDDLPGLEQLDDCDVALVFFKRMQ